MNPTLIHYIKHYAFGVATSAFNGGITGLSALCVMGEAGKLPEGITAHVLIHTFAVSCAVHGLIWLKANPFPEKLSDFETVTTTETATVKKESVSSTPTTP